jgi:3-phenylpropionate/trans-cinnamate dioxygenase ferredoxin subunit
MPEFVPVCSTNDVPDPGRIVVEVDDQFIVVIHAGGDFYALDDVCTHDGGTLSDGTLDDTGLSCLRHGAKFDFRTGAALSMPAVKPTRSHEVKVDDGQVCVKLNRR